MTFLKHAVITLLLLFSALTVYIGPEVMYSVVLLLGYTVVGINPFI